MQLHDSVQFGRKAIAPPPLDEYEIIDQIDLAVDKLRSAWAALHAKSILDERTYAAIANTIDMGIEEVQCARDDIAAAGQIDNGLIILIGRYERAIAAFSARPDPEEDIDETSSEHVELVAAVKAFYGFRCQTLWATRRKVSYIMKTQNLREWVFSCVDDEVLGLFFNSMSEEEI